jgi:hypothetical protein
MLVATMCANIAWAHYYIVLVIPVMFFLDRERAERRWIWGALAAVIFAMNLYPLSFGLVHLYFKPYSVMRSQFYAGAICMGALLWLAWRIRLTGPRRAGAAKLNLTYTE